MKTTIFSAFPAVLLMCLPVAAQTDDSARAGREPGRAQADPFDASDTSRRSAENSRERGEDRTSRRPTISRERREADVRNMAAPKPVPDPYRRPELDVPLFEVENLSLDKEQVADLADTLARLVCTRDGSPETRNPVFQAQVLGIVLRLDPRHQAAVVANSRLEDGREPSPIEPAQRMRVVHGRLMTYAGHLLDGAGGSSDDRALGRYLADLGRRVYPDGDEAVVAHQNLLDRAGEVDWSAVLPPLVAEQPVTPPEPEDKANDPQDSGVARTDPPRRNPETESRPRERAGGDEKIQLSGKITRDEVEFATVALAGDQRSRAAQRIVTLRNRDYSLEYREWENRTVRVPMRNHGRSRLVFSNRFSDSMQERWSEIASGEFSRRFENFPRNTEIDVLIPGYRSNSGTSAILSVALAAEAMVRGITPDPKVSAIGTWNGEGRINAHSHLSGVVLGYAKDWRPILITPRGRRSDLEELADIGLAMPFLNVQVLEFRQYRECADFVFGNREEAVSQAIAKFEEIQNLRRTMEPQAIVANQVVQGRLREITELMPDHMSAAMLLRAAENQNPLDVRDSVRIISRLYRPLELMAGNDIRTVPEREGLEAVEIFGERYRELRGRMDPSIRRLELRFDDVTKSFVDTLRLKDRTTGSALRRIEQMRNHVTEGRNAIDAFVR